MGVQSFDEWQATGSASPRTQSFDDWKSGIGTKVASVVSKKHKFGKGEISLSDIILPLNEAKALQNAPEANFSEGIKNPALKFLSSIPESIINAPSETARGIGNISADIKQGETTPTRLLGHLAQVAQGPLAITGVGGVAKATGQQALKQAVIQSAKVGAKTGGAFGFLSGLEQGTNAPNVGEQLKGTIVPTIIGTGVGAVTGAATPVVTKAFKAGVKALADKPNLQPGFAKIPGGKSSVQAGKSLIPEEQVPGTTSPTGTSLLSPATSQPSQTQMPIVPGQGVSTPLGKNSSGGILTQPGQDVNKVVDIGVSAFRGAPVKTIAETEPYFGTTRSKGFVNSLSKSAEEFKVKTTLPSKAVGVWEGNLEPSFAFQATGDPNAVKAYVVSHGAKMNQDSVGFFTPNESALGTKYLFKGIQNPDTAIALLKNHGISGATFDKSTKTLSVWDMDGNLGQNVLSYSEVLGIKPTATKGSVEFIDKADYAKTLAEYKQIQGNNSGYIATQRSGGNVSTVESQAGAESPPANPPNIPNTEPGKYAGSINLNKLNISPEAKQALDTLSETIKPELEAAKGRPMTQEEVLKAAQSSDILTKIIPREQTLQMNAALTKLRQAVAAGSEGQGISKDFIENVRVLNSVATDAGRNLKAFDIGADPSLSTIKEDVVKQLLKVGADTDEIIKASEKVDFNNPKQVTAFVRRYLDAGFWNTVKEYRYINLLSSPQTHLVNAFSNLTQVGGLSPATKLVSGTTDFIASKLTGKQQQHYVAEVPAYYRGAFNSMGDAVSGFVNALKGNVFIERPDINRLPSGNKALAPLQVFPRLLEASDILFRTLAKGGEKESLALRYAKMGKIVAPEMIDKQAGDKAAYYIFRAAVDPSNASKQGHLLSYIDKFTKQVYSLRTVPGIGWFIPFVQTPMNILKQGIEYSPAGFATVAGAGDKTEQIAKALIGSGVFAGAGYLASVGDSTWAAPTSQKDKEMFYAAGRQPYSIKIGDHWISFSRLGPLAYPIAMATAWKYYSEQDPKAVTENQVTQFGKTLAGLSKFFSDQSYMQGLGDLIKAVQGDEYYVKQAIANFPEQLVPLSSLQRWVTTMVDPIYKHPRGIVESLEAGSPFFSKNVPAYTNPLGQPSVRQNPIPNALSPARVTKGIQPFEAVYSAKAKQKQITAIQTKAKDIAQSVSTGDISSQDAAKMINDMLKKAFATQ